MQPDFWQDSGKAQQLIQEMQDLKIAAEGGSKYDRGNAIITVFAGAGGDDSEDFVRMLLEMYMRFTENKGWVIDFIDQNQNTVGGYRTVTCEIIGKNAYGMLKHEAGVHRLVRKSPFNSKGARHTSFAMVEVLPILEKQTDIIIPEDELEIEFTKASGPGGQNVNKRETAVRVVHKPTGFSAFVAQERSQVQNREKAVEMVKAKVFAKKQEEEKAKEVGMSIASTTSAQWGSQIRSYVLHPYQMVKDHRTDTEVRDTDKVFGGEIDIFIDAMKEKSVD